MLRAVKDLKDYGILATDGPIGQVVDVLMDDRSWTMRYFVVDTGTWLSDRKVLISPLSVGQPDWAAQQLPVTLSKARVENSPEVNTDNPVLRQHEIEQLSYYGYPLYWEVGGLSGVVASPGVLEADTHLRSVSAVQGFQIVARDGELGHVDTILVDDQTWTIRYFVVNTGSWWSGHHVLISPQWVERITWEDATVTLDMTRDAIQNAPPYDAEALFDRQHEMAMYEHYGRPKYWAEETPDPASDPRP